MPQMTTLQLAQEFCRRQGLPIPQTVVSNQDDTVQQVLGLLNEGIMDLCDRYEWQQLVQGLTFYHGGAADYTAINLDTGVDGFKYMLPRTLWDITSRIEVAGPLTEQEWRVLTTMLIASARYSYQIKNNKLRIFPAPSPLTSIQFKMQWATRYGVTTATGAYTETYTADDSYSRLQNYIILQDLKWRWRQAKGLPYAEDQRACEEMCVNAIGREPTQTLILDSPDPGSSRAGPGLLIPAGSWNLP